MAEKLRINEIAVADTPQAWRAAGFHVDDDRVVIGESFVIRLTGEGGGISGFTLGIPERVDSSETNSGGLSLTIAPPSVPDDVGLHENGVTHAMKAVVLTAETAASIERLQQAVPELGGPPVDGHDESGTHYAIWPLAGTEVGLEVVSLSRDQGPDVMLALFLVVDDLKATIDRIGANDVGPIEIYSGREMVRIKPRIGVTAGIHLLSKAD
jgi:hypothetical protein